MDAFEKARQKYEKNRLQQGRSLPNTDIEKAFVPPKKEERPALKPATMRVSVDGPVSLSFVIYYGGTFPDTQMANLPALLKKQLAVFGRVE